MCLSQNIGNVIYVPFKHTSGEVYAIFAFYKLSNINDSVLT